MSINTENPQSRIEKYLAVIAGVEGITLEPPQSRIEEWLQYIVENGIGGTSDHSQLTNRSLPAQHPISSIDGLEQALDGKGTYSKPTGGIPASDMAQTVQQDLGKAHDALTSTDTTLAVEGKAADAKATGQEIAKKQDKPAAAGTAGQVLSLNQSLQPVWTDPQSGGGSSPDPHPYALDGANLKTVFGTAAALYAALAQNDYSKIRNLDYWPITFNGTYRDYGEWVALTGTDYYSDTACKDLVGQVESDTVVSYEDASPAYYSATISGTKRYIKMQDCQRWREKTINMTAKMEANINAYWGYGDSGTISGKVPHIMWLARDGIASLKFRSTNQQWADAVEQIETGDGSTTEYTPDDATLKCVRYCTVDGVLKAYNTDYTVDTGTGKLTFKAGKVPTSGQEIIISRTTHDYPWKGSALYQTFNDPDHGLLRLIDDTEFASHIYGGAGGLGMRYAGETRPVSNSTSVSWTDRGKMFLPTESEVWGLGIYGQKDTWYHLPQLAVFANGGRRRLSKAATDGGSRTSWWVASSYSAPTIAYVYSHGRASSSHARCASAAVPGFIGT